MSGDFQQFSVYHDVDLYNDYMHLTALDVKAAWGWCTFAINTVLTASIAIKILYVVLICPGGASVNRTL